MTTDDRLRAAARMLETTTRTHIENPAGDRVERDAVAALLRAVDAVRHSPKSLHLIYDAADDLAALVLGDTGGWKAGIPRHMFPVTKRSGGSDD